MEGKAEAHFKDSRDKWKNKAKGKSLLAKKTQKRVVELIESRDNWRQKYFSLKSHASLPVKTYDKVAYHTYDSGIIWLSVWMQIVGKCSFRSCRHMVIGLGLYLGVQSRIPSASSIRMWVCKYGYYRYHQLKDTNSEWAIIVDESVNIGQERLLLILGVNLGDEQKKGWEFNRSLSSADVEVLGVEIATSWTSKAISERIDKLRESYKIAYGVSDEGNNIQGAWKLQNMLSINDCTHTWAKALENLYKDDANFIDFLRSVSALRKKWILSKSAHLLPPAMRVKSRFHQIFEWVNWSENIQEVWTKLSPEQQQELAFIQAHQPLLKALNTIQKLVKALNNILKIKGLSQATIEQSLALLKAELPDLPKVYLFKEMAEKYLMQHQNTINNTQSFLCCSDIIESTFGSYKQTIAKNNSNITELVLSIASLGKKFTPQQIKTAMQEVKIKDVAQWKKENTTPSLTKIKRDFFNKNGMKK